MNMHQQGGVANGVVRPNAGVDVSKSHLDVCVASMQRRVLSDPDGWNELTMLLQSANVDLVVVEATGSYERGMVCALHGAGMCVARVNPRQARDFTDVLARHADRHKFITPVIEPARQLLAKLMTRRRQLVDMRVAESNRVEHAGASAAKSIRSVLKLLDSVKGVGPVTILTLTSALPELGQLGRRQIAKLAGVAPLADPSGGRSGKRRIWGGRADVRSVVYMAAIVAMRHNPVIREFYERLPKASKPKKVAIVACMRKRLTILNAMLRDQAIWNAPRHVKLTELP